MAKSFGTAGGIIATSNGDFADRIRLAGSPLVFGGPIPPPTLGASIASAEIHLSSGLAPLQRDLGDRIRLVNEFSVEIGVPLMVREHNPLWFMEVGGFADSFALAERMRDSGFYLNPAVFPAVPRGHGGVRFTVTNYNSLTQIEDMLTCLNTIRLEMFGKTDVEVDLGSDDSSRTEKEHSQGSEG
jgi:7-keto-8-aminopelargonate synthetase-like enzyme